MKKKLLSLRNFTLLLILIHICFILLTPILLESILLSSISPLTYLIIIFSLGLKVKIQSKRPVLMILLAGYLSQLPGIACALIIFSGKLSSLVIPEAFDFIIQLWHAPFAPLFPYLPRVQLWRIPLYYLLTLILSFVIPFLPTGAALFKNLSSEL